MTSTVLVVVTQNPDPASALQSPSGLKQGNTRFQILDSAGTVAATQDVAALQATFTGIADGDFTATAQLLDTAGNPLGTVLSKAFTDGAPVVTTFQPLNDISVTVTPDAVAAPATPSV